MVKIERDPTQDVCMDNHFPAGFIVSKMKLVCLACGCRLTLSGSAYSRVWRQGTRTPWFVCSDVQNPRFREQAVISNSGGMKHPDAVHVTVAACHQSMVRVQPLWSISTWVEGRVCLHRVDL
ncbi:hypothetical protein M758_9G163500 [Ceratodon purpureus]|nr:hypothetical protein M758_9G163500 [Ceratodon purpureus]